MEMAANHSLIVTCKYAQHIEGYTAAVTAGIDAAVAVGIRQGYHIRPLSRGFPSAVREQTVVGISLLSSNDTDLAILDFSVCTKGYSGIS